MRSDLEKCKDDISVHIAILILKEKYRTLSKIEEMFKKNSIHPVAKHVNQELTEICKQLDELNTYKK